MLAGMFFDGWQGPLRVVVVGTLAYVALVALLRVTGKRTLSQMNAFDFVVTVALGSTVATVLLSSEVAWVEGVVALALLVLLQWVVAWMCSRSKAVSALVKAEPTLLFYQGAFLRDALLRERVTEQEVISAIRSSRYPRLEDVEGVILETSGTFSVIGRTRDAATSLRGVTRKDETHA